MSYNCFQMLIQSGKAKFNDLIWKEVEEEEEVEPFLNEQMPQVHNFSHYRETLLGEHRIS